MKKIILIAWICCAGSLEAQQQADPSFVWGGLAGFESQFINIQSISVNAQEHMSVDAGRAVPGGCLGVFGRWGLTKGLSYQQELTFSTLQSRVDFYPDGTEYYHFTDVELPMHFVLTNSADPDAPLRGSFLLGARVGWNFAEQTSSKLYLLHERLAIDAGLGVEVRLKKWRLQPEFVYSLGLNNLHNVTNAPYDWVAGRVVRDKLIFRLLFWIAY